jgi:outer membrane protein
MIGNLRRQIAAIAVTGLLAFAPVPGMAQNLPPAQDSAPAPTPQQAPPPAQTPAPTDQNSTPAPIPQQEPPPGQPFHIPLGPDYSIIASRPYFPNVLLPYKTMHMDSPQLVNSPRIEQLIQNGQLRITVQDAIELGLENNTDISVQRYNSWLWETDILRAKAGNIIRGVAVTGTNLPIANLPLITYDPALQATFGLDSKVFPVNNPITAGTGSAGTGSGGGSTLETTVVPPGLGTHTLTGNFSYTQGFQTGTTITASLDSNRATTTSAAATFNPAINTVGTFAFSQQLLNGFGFDVNQRYIKVAKIGKKASDYFFLQSVLTDVTAIENDYWELVFARNNVAVQQRAVDLAQRLYEDNQRQVQVGTLAPIEVVRAQAQIASAQQSLITAQTTQLQDQALLMSVITKDPLAPAVVDVEIVPLDTVQNPPLVENIPIVDAVKEAMANRPDVLQSVVNLDADDVNVRNTRAALLPSLVLSGYVNSVGLSGNSKAGTTVVPAGWFDSASQLFQGEFPEYEAQIALNIPIRNRSNEADSARALLTKRQDQERLQATYNTVAVDVRNAQITLQQARAELAAAQKTRELQEQTLAAEQTKFQLGASTVFNVVSDQATLEVAAGAEVRALSDLAKANVNFERAMGRTLKVHNITISDAVTGTPAKDTLIPGTTVAGDIVGQKPGY